MRSRKRSARRPATPTCRAKALPTRPKARSRRASARPRTRCPEPHRANGGAVMSKGQSSETAKKIEKDLAEKTGDASGDTEKSAQEKFDEMGERKEIQEKAGRA